ncbi:MAG: hypothetical protein IIA53_09345 [Chloroflexi bacterium]|nr:hypothetical protein [Chloroflexota bacterium]
MQQHQSEHRNTRKRPAEFGTPSPGDDHFARILEAAESHAYRLGVVQQIVSK